MTTHALPPVPRARRQLWPGSGSSNAGGEDEDGHDSLYSNDSQLFFEDDISLADSDLGVEHDTGRSPNELETSVPFSSSLGQDFLSLFAAAK